MKTQRNKIRFLVLIFLAIFLSGYSAPRGKRTISARKDYKKEFLTKKGVCRAMSIKEYHKSTGTARHNRKR